MTTQLEPNTNSLPVFVRIPLDILKGIWDFIAKISQNRSGFIGFIGLVIYFIITFVMPSFVPFDDEANLD
ncbi:MAG: hypothetical protein ACPG7F_12495, partial [Aggregatilineales bacterium]